MALLSSGKMEIDMEQYLSYFGQRLKQLRTEARLTQAELAERLGVGQSYIAAIERAERGKQPTLSFVLSVYRLFGVGVDNLLGIDRVPLESPPTELETLPPEVRAPIEEMIRQLARKQRGDRWRTLSTQIATAGGEEHVNRASRQTGVTVAPEKEPELVCN
jgi:transcriptional regulator with XRE-family HTH domain